MIERYDATVTNFGAEKMDGSIKVSCVGLLGDEDSELPMWIRPAFDWGWFFVPNVGEIVEVEAHTSSDRDEMPGQFSIDNLDLVWRGKRIYNDDTSIHTDFITPPYGKKRGFATPSGHILLFDDSDLEPKVYLTRIGSALPTDGDSTIIMDSDGIKISIMDGEHFIHLKENEISIELDGGPAVTITDKNADSTFELGNGAVSVAIAETLQALLDARATTHNIHFHPDSMGGTGTPPVPMDVWDPQIISTKMTLPDN